jgi:hypothetical protein
MTKETTKCEPVAIRPRYNLDTEIAFPNGTKVMNGDKPHTIASILTDVLLAHDPVANLSGKEKMERFQLALRVNAGGQQPLSHEDIVLVKKLVDKNFGPLFVGIIYGELDK